MKKSTAFVFHLKEKQNELPDRKRVFCLLYTSVRLLYESELYEITIKDVKLFPQGYSALALHPEYLKNEPSVLLVDIGGWTVDLMRLRCV